LIGRLGKYQNGNNRLHKMNYKFGCLISDPGLGIVAALDNLHRCVNGASRLFPQDNQDALGIFGEFMGHLDLYRAVEFSPLSRGYCPHKNVGIDEPAIA
jgi:hypothetical protein